MFVNFFIGRPMRGDLVPEWMEHYASSATMRRARLKRELADQPQH